MAMVIDEAATRDLLFAQVLVPACQWMFPGGAIICMHFYI